MVSLPVTAGDMSSVPGLVPTKPVAAASPCASTREATAGRSPHPPSSSLLLTTRGSLLTATDPAQPKIKFFIEKRTDE